MGVVERCEGVVGTADDHPAVFQHQQIGVTADQDGGRAVFREGDQIFVIRIPA